MEKNKNTKKIEEVKVVSEKKKDGNNKIVCLIVVLTLIILGIIFFIFFKPKVTICSKNLDQSASGYKITNEYKIKSVRGIAKSAELTDIVTSNNNTILAYFEKQYMDSYSKEKERYGGYVIKTESKDNSVIVNVKVDFSRVNIEKLASDNSIIIGDIKNNKLSLNGAKKIYTNIGAACEK